MKKLNNDNNILSYSRKALIALLSVLMLGVGVFDADARRRQTSKRTSPQQETSADVKKQEQDTRREIKRTEAQIRENDKSIAVGISNLRRLEGDIIVSQKEVGTLSARVGTLKQRIASLEKQIAAYEANLSKMRTDYMKAVKKMRVARKKQSDLAFIFSARNFAQALRRMRYLKEFSAWREKQSALISATVAQLREQQKLLTANRKDLQTTLDRQVVVKNKLESQHSQQDKLVMELRKNGEALRAHLARKQSEANALRNQIASLIAQEEARRQAEEARREEARREEARKAEERRQAEARKAEEHRLAEAQARREAEAAEAQRKAEEKTTAQVAPSQKQSRKESEKSAQKTAAKNTQKKQAQQQPPQQKTESEKTYAEARKRRPRGGKQGDGSNASAPRQSTPAPKVETPDAPAAADNGFGSMKGRLPRPVSGAFRVVSRFGRQTLPDMPDVEYDNPGIDAEVASGASALAVYPGKVSAIYVLPGYSNVVIVNHGGYYTVYGNIQSPSVSVGQQLKQGQSVGRIAPDSDDPSRTLLHFEVWKKRDKLNPMSWIR